jgi:hypothetical protein
LGENQTLGAEEIRYNGSKVALAIVERRFLVLPVRGKCKEGRVAHYM